MSVSLKKGQTFDLTKDNPTLRRVLVGLGWDPGENEDIDVDGSAICFDANGNMQTIVFFNSKSAFNGAILHHGDNLTGEGEGDDEQIQMDLDSIPSNTVRVSIIVNVYKAFDRHQDFGQISNCFIHIDDMDNGTELVRYQIDKSYYGKTGIFVADIYRYKNTWKIRAIDEAVLVKDILEMARIKEALLRK